MAGAGGTYAALADLPVQVDGWTIQRHERETSSGFTRTTSVFVLRGGGHRGRGEDVTYETEFHDDLTDQPPLLGLTGDRSLDEAASVLDGMDLFPARAPERTEFRGYRRWAVESALLDLALKQAGTDLAGAVGREPESVRFLVSTGLGDPPSAAPVRRWLAVDPALEFKVDATRPWPDAVTDALAATDRVRAIDLKAHYASLPGTAAGEEAPSWVGDPEPDVPFYETLLDRFPTAVIEDPAVTEASRPILEPAADRLSWDGPVHSVAEFEALPLAVGWCNVKPSRFGTLERLFGFIDHAESAGVRLYGGGQFELAVGRGQLHALASLFYPDGPNDIAPRPYNDPEPRPGLPASPLPVPEPEPGFGWAPPGG